MKDTVRYMVESYNMLNQLRAETADVCTRCAIDNVLSLGRAATAELEKHARDQRKLKETCL